MSLSGFFAADYFAARDRFRAATADDGFRREVHEIAARGPDGETLTIDAAILGSTDPRRVVIVSSGLHGVEGYFGSAVQLAWLEQRAPKSPVPADAAVVLVHALNPFGFAWRRRWNENNVDLNRNFLDDRSFLADDGTYAESRRVYERMNSFLNPRSPQSPFEPYTLQALRHILALGLESRARKPAGQRPPLLALKAVGALGLGELKKTLPVGQYEHRHGLFYGGDGPEQTTRIVQERLPAWVGRAETIIHVDFHTGLGAHGTYKHLLIDPEASKRTAWLGAHLGTDVIEPCRRGDGLRGTRVDGGVFHRALLGSELSLPDGGIRDVCPDPRPRGLEGRESGPLPRQAGLPRLRVGEAPARRGLLSRVEGLARVDRGPGDGHHRSSGPGVFPIAMTEGSPDGAAREAQEWTVPLEGIRGMVCVALGSARAWGGFPLRCRRCGAGTPSPPGGFVVF